MPGWTEERERAALARLEGLREIEQIDVESLTEDDDDFVSLAMIKNEADLADAIAEIERLRTENMELSRPGVHWWLKMREVALLLGCGSLDDVAGEVKRLKQITTRLLLLERLRLFRGKPRPHPHGDYVRWGDVVAAMAGSDCDAAEAAGGKKDV